jgi:hypothetical protein
MKQFLLLVLAVVGLVALIPTQSKAQVTISVGPGYSNGYYDQGQPYYYRHYANRYYPYHYNQRYYRSHQWHNND